MTRAVKKAGSSAKKTAARSPVARGKSKRG
jgi:hypothetical protein